MYLEGVGAGARDGPSRLGLASLRGGGERLTVKQNDPAIHAVRAVTVATLLTTSQPATNSHRLSLPLLSAPPPEQHMRRRGPG